MKRFKYLPVLLVIFLFACGSGEDKMLEQISQSEAALIEGEGTLADHKALCLKFAEAYPRSKKAAVMKFRAGVMEFNEGNYNAAITCLNELMHTWPNSEEYSEAVFLKGFIFENNIFRFDSAKYCYEYYLEKFPNGSKAEDVRFSLKNLGKPPEQLLYEIIRAKQNSE